MAFQRDYILRMIEMMGDFLRRLGDMIDEKERLHELDALCREHCGLPLDTARNLTDESLRELLTPQARFVLSEIMYLRARALIAKDEQEQADLLKSARLLLTMTDDISLCAERAERLKELLAACQDALLPDDYINAARFFMTGEHYDDCEDAIFMAADAAGSADDRHYCILQGLALLSDMRVLPNDSLVPGGMSRADVDRAISDLNKLDG